ncbi:MAG: glycosyltransferase [Phycisphaeraceae bacterium]
MMGRDKPRVGHVLHRLQVAGAEVLAADLVRRLSDRFDFTLLCLDGIGELGETLAAEGHDVIELGRRPGIDLALARRLGRALRERGVDLVHAHQYTPFFYAAVGRTLSRRGGRPPILFTEHGRHYPDPRKGSHLLANRLLLRRRDRVTAVGAFVKSALIRNEGIPERRIEVVYNGIDPARFRPRDDASIAEARDRLGLDRGTPVLMQVARFHRVKDHATSVRAVAELAGRGMDFVMVYVGDGERRAEMHQLAEQLDVADRCRFVGVRRDVHEILPAADVFMLSSVSEGVSVTLLEAMATGVPIVATDVGGNPEVVEHGETGLLSPRGDAPAMARNLETLLGDAELRHRMSEAGRRRLHETFTQERMHRRYAELYEQMTAPNASKEPRTK